jgi:hypothetical protein
MNTLKFVQAAVAVLFSVVIASCASVPNIPISGNTTASPTLRNDMLEMLSTLFEADANCSKIDTVETEVMSDTLDPNSALYAMGKMQGGKPEDAIKERWTAIGCGQRMPLEMVIVPDGKGGSLIYSDWPK